MNLTFPSIFSIYISKESLRPALLVSLLSVAVLIGLFTYLNSYTKRRYFTLWTVAWLFYGVWLTLDFNLLNLPENLFLLMFKQLCVGNTAVFLVWGSCRFLGLRVRELTFGLFMAFVVVWSYVGIFLLENKLAIQMPVFGLIGLSSLLTAHSFYQHRRKRKYMGAGLLAFGFLLWGFFFGTYPLIEHSDDLVASGFFISAVLQLFIAVSMIILVLEEARAMNRLAMQQIHSHKTEKIALKTQAVSTEERYRSLFDQASEGIVIAAAHDLRILELNQTAQRLLGINQAEASQQVLPTFCQIGDIAKAHRTGEEWFDWICQQARLELVQKGGGVTPTEVDGAEIDFKGQPAYQFFFREMTDRSRLEQQLRQAEKLSALGRMISGVAHELNNPLAVIKGYLELVLAHHELQPQTRSDLEKVARECNRTAKLVRNFLALSREQSSHREMVAMNELIQRLAEFRRFDLIVAGMNLSLELEAKLPETSADPDQIQQLITNLLNNGMQALAELPPPHELKIRTVRNDNVLQIWVEDNGTGVPPELEAKIFEPFFTTKEVGSGTGLGLSIAHGIMTEHQGRIFYQKSSMGGAAFVLEFPVVGVPVVPIIANSNSRSVPAQLNEMPAIPANILVLDDEKSIAELICEMLNAMGHRPALCLAPVDALELIGKQEVEFDLIISDFRMPVMNGREFHEAVAESNPKLAKRIVFLTGDVINEDTHTFLETNGNPHLAKPFQLGDLQQIVRDALANQAAVKAVETV